MTQSASISEQYTNSDLFLSYYLKERLRRLDAWDCDETARKKLNELQELFEQELDLVSKYDEDDLIEKWIDEVLCVLGYETLGKTTLPNSDGFVDRLLFGSHDDMSTAAFLRDDNEHGAAYGRALCVLEAKQWDESFEKQFSNRKYRDASHQIKHYLERTPEQIQWGILTNGNKWRLYGTNDYETKTYYEVDLPELLETDDVDAFKYFYLFFRPDAFREIAGETFLNQVYEESEIARQKLGEDLQDNVFTALRVLGEGFVESNDLEINPRDTMALNELKDQSLVLLYRLMFVLYAEDNKLINPDDATAEKKYIENFSLDHIRTDILRKIDSAETFESEYAAPSTQIWSRLRTLFRLIDDGYDELGIPAYDGGLFDEEKHSFLAENEVNDPYLAEIIYRLSRVLTLSVTVRYKPDDPADFETDGNGYATVGPVPTMEFVSLSEEEATLVEEFVPVAVKEELGKFRKGAGATITPLERFKEYLTLPNLNDIGDDFDRYLDRKVQTENLDTKIERTDDLIDQIAYRLYRLTDEEIAIVEQAVDN